MQTAYHIAGLWDIASKDCRLSKDNTLETAIWKEKNLVTLGLLQNSFNNDLITLMTHKTHVFCIWKMLKLQLKSERLRIYSVMVPSAHPPNETLDLTSLNTSRTSRKLSDISQLLDGTSLSILLSASSSPCSHMISMKLIHRMEQ